MRKPDWAGKAVPFVASTTSLSRGYSLKCNIITRHVRDVGFKGTILNPSLRSALAGLCC